MDSFILQVLTGDSNTRAKLVNEDNLKSNKPSSFTATILDIKSVFAIFPGKVLYIGYYQGMGTVDVLVGEKEIVRYLNLTDIPVDFGEEIKQGAFLGLPDKKYGLQFEYCSEIQGTSNMPVRININNKIITYFKHNPIDLLEGNYVPRYLVQPTQMNISPSDTVELTAEQRNEFSITESVVPVPPVNENAYMITSLADIPLSMLDECSNNGRGLGY